MMPLGTSRQQNGGAAVKRRASLKGKGRQLPSTATTTATHDESRTATLHRVRFLDYMPSSILAIALTPQSYDPATHHPYLPSLHTANGREILAVGRQNGEIEIYTWIGGEGTPPSERQQNKEKGRRRRASLSAPIVSANKQGWVLERVRLPAAESFSPIVCGNNIIRTDRVRICSFNSAWHLLPHLELSTCSLRIRRYYPKTTTTYVKTKKKSVKSLMPFARASLDCSLQAEVPTCGSGSGLTQKMLEWVMSRCDQLFFF